MKFYEVEKLLDKKVKIIFKKHDERFPMIGKFIKFKDFDELKSKDMVRFVNQSRLDFYKDNVPSVALSRIYVVTDFSQIILV